MPFCPNCGKEISRNVKFCPSCGRQLVAGLEEKAGAASLRNELGTTTQSQMSWFERHLNWTMVLAWVGTYVMCFLVGAIVVSVDPYVSEDAIEAVGFVIGLLAPIPAAYWVLRKKNRSMWWLLLSPSFFFLLIGNKSGTEAEVEGDSKHD